MQNVRLRLDAWREAERVRDRLASGSPEWLVAEQEVRTAEKLYHAEVAQARARYAVEESQGWEAYRVAQPDPRTAAARD